MYRFIPVAVFGVIALLAGIAGAFTSAAWLVLAVPAALLFAVGIYDLVQPWHSILRNYPVLGHLCFLMEDVQLEIQQYFSPVGRWHHNYIDTDIE